MLKLTTKVALTALSLAFIPQAQAGMSPLRSAVTAFYNTSEAVMDAVAHDVCDDKSEMLDKRTAGAKLRGNPKKSYIKIMNRLGDAYKATEGTDGEVQQVRDDFCNAVWAAYAQSE